MRSYCLLMTLCIFVMLPGNAQGSLADRLRALPVSVGDNHTITWPRGDTWVDVGIREHVGHDHMTRANPRTFRPGARLFIAGRHNVPALVDDGLIINVPELMLYRLQQGKPVDWYPVSVGMLMKRWHTPMGPYTIARRVIDPYFRYPAWAGGGLAPPGPGNPLGDRALVLSDPLYGIHSTNDPTTIGRYVSHGCIRMFPPHMHALFPQTVLGMAVVLRYETFSVGQQDGIVYLSVFPDVYRRGVNTVAHLRETLATYDLDGVLSDSELKTRLRQADGVARPLLGSNTRVTLNGVAVDADIRTTMRGGVGYLPLSALATALSAGVQGNTITVTRDGRTRTYTANAGFNALGEHFVPVRALAQALGATLQVY